MKFVKNTYWLLVPVFIVLLSSCASTYITGTWKDAEYTRPIQNILVIGLAENKGSRRNFENTLSTAFNQAGKKAAPSFTFFEDISKISKETVGPIVKDKQFDEL